MQAAGCGKRALRKECAAGSSLHALEASLAPARLGVGRRGRSVSVGFQGSPLFHKRCLSCNRRRTSPVIKAASTEYNKCEFRHIGSPLEPRSQTGRLLSDVLQNQPHNLHAAAMDLLRELAMDRDGAVARSEHSHGSCEADLHRRIAVMKEQKYEAAVEEVMYILVVGDFSRIKVPLVPRLSDCTTDGRMEIWPSKDKELESIHCPELLPLVKEHLSNILRREGKHGGVMRWWSRAQMSKLQLGRLYAASTMYGYFLTAASTRHRLEHMISGVDADHPLGCTVCIPQLSNLEQDPVVASTPHDAASSLSLCPCGPMRKPRGLRSYISAFDPLSLKLCTKLRSRAAANLIENHTLAILGDGDAGDLGSEGLVSSVVSVSYSGLKRLMLEGVAFGTFLWTSEQLVDSIYRLQEDC